MYLAIELRLFNILTGTVYLGCNQQCLFWLSCTGLGLHLCRVICCEVDLVQASKLFESGLRLAICILHALLLTFQLIACYFFL